MSDIDLEKISRLMSQKLEQNILIEKIEKIGSGYHSDGFRLTARGGKAFFLKRVKSHDLGFEIPERKVFSLMVSHSMQVRAGREPQAVGLILDNNYKSVLIPEVGEQTAIYHIQEFEPAGPSYWSLMQSRKNKIAADKQDTDELNGIVDYIWRIHKIKYPSRDIARLNSVYNDGIRSVLIHPELTIMMLHDFSESHPILPPKKQKDYIGLMLDLIHKWRGRHDRLSALHGDFWGGNLFFRTDGTIWVIDYSRIPWGDPGIDIGWWISQYLWLYCETGNNYFRELGEKFFEKYEQKSGDKEIRQAAALSIGFCCVVNLSPKFYPNLNLEAGKKFFKNVLEILRGGEFVWEKRKRNFIKRGRSIMKQGKKKR